MANINLERRSQIGTARRNKTRQGIVDAAARLFAQHGFDAPTTDDLVAEAGVARGTFYGHFDTKEELMRCVAREFVDGIERGFSELLEGIDDPAQRIALRIRFLCEKAVESSTWGWLVIRIIPTGPLGTSSRHGFLKDLTSGSESGQLRIRSVQSALDLIQGTVIMGTRTVLVGTSKSGSHIDDLLVSILIALGIPLRSAEKLAAGSKSSYRKSLQRQGSPAREVVPADANSPRSRSAGKTVL